MAEATGDMVGRKTAKFCGSRSAPDASTAFMSVERTSVSAHPPALLATDDSVNGGSYPAVLMHLFWCWVLSDYKEKTMATTTDLS